MTERESFWQRRLERLGNPNFAGPVLVALAIEEASVRIADAIEKTGSVNSGLGTAQLSIEDMPTSGDNDGGT